MRFLKSFYFAFNGIRYTWSNGLNFKIQCIIAFFTLLFGFYLKLSWGSICILLLCISIILSLEMINTAIEKLCDFVSLENNPKIGLIKDISAGAVLVASIIVLLIGLFIFLPKIQHLIY